MRSFVIPKITISKTKSRDNSSEKKIMSKRQLLQFIEQPGTKGKILIVSENKRSKSSEKED